MSTDVDVSHFREHRTLDECKSLLHYGHVIPICHGYTATFVADNYGLGRCALSHRVNSRGSAPERSTNACERFPDNLG